MPKNESVTTPKPVPKTFRQWLESEIEYLSEIKLTEHGEGSLATAKRALKEYDERI